MLLGPSAAASLQSRPHHNDTCSVITLSSFQQVKSKSVHQSNNTAASHLQSINPLLHCVFPARAKQLRRYAQLAATALPQHSLELGVKTVQDFAAELPIRECIEDVVTGLSTSNCLVLQAPPGAGKTTVVPLALLMQNDEYLQPRQKILLLEPRRVAAKAAARRMAAQLGEPVGETVGYRVRLETRVSSKTRIEVVTDGILLRMLQQDPSLQQVGAILFDEFHERNLDSDLSLALCLDAQRLGRPDLRLAVMSATLGGGLAEDVADLMASCQDDDQQRAVPVVTSEGCSYPVRTSYLGGWERRERMGLEQKAAGAIAGALRSELGDVLCFLPGVGEIGNTQRLLQELLPAAARQAVRVLPLHGNLSAQQQDLAIRPDREGLRRVILATPIAESSLTIDGVRIVVDAGFRRAPLYDLATGISRLQLLRASRASADQRRGRAGRTGPGVCYRLWDEDAELEESTPPEILDADLAPLVLELALWGCPDGRDLPWLDPPDDERMAAALQLLQDLGAVDAKGAVTAEGRQMARLGVHPRFAHMVLQGQRLGCAELACVLASVLSERDILRGRDVKTADIGVRLKALAAGDAAVDRAAASRILESARKMLQQLRRRDVELAVSEPQQTLNLDDPPQLQKWVAQLQRDAMVGVLLALAYPDRIAQRAQRSNARAAYQLSAGRNARLLNAEDPLQLSQFIAIAELGGGRDGMNDVVQLAAGLSQAAIDRHLQEMVHEVSHVFWASGSKQVLGRRQLRLGSLVLKEQPLQLTEELALPALLQGVKEMGWKGLPISKDTEAWRQRVCWLRSAEGASSQLPDLDDKLLIATAKQWLAPHLLGCRSKADLQKLQWGSIIRGLLSWEQQQHVQQQVPTHMEVPTGSRIPIDYSREQPTVCVRMQEVFGLMETPRVASGRVPLLMELLSPRGTPLQVTADLANFWATSYTEVKKDMKGRYPKHYWPDDPSQAEPTKMTKKQMEIAKAKAEGKQQQVAAAGGKRR